MILNAHLICIIASDPLEEIHGMFNVLKASFNASKRILREMPPLFCLILNGRKENRQLDESRDRCPFQSLLSLPWFQVPSFKWTCWGHTWVTPVSISKLIEGPSSPWTHLQDTHNYSSQSLQMNTLIPPQKHPYLSSSATQAGLSNSLQQNFSPVAPDLAVQYIES